jgi:preprotein translocase subunit SecG
MNSSVFNVVQIILSILLVITILLQQKGAGVGGIFGGSSNIYSTKRGVDKVLFYATIVIACLFFGLSLSQLFF